MKKPKNHAFLLFILLFILLSSFSASFAADVEWDWTEQIKRQREVYVRDVKPSPTNKNTIYALVNDNGFAGSPIFLRSFDYGVTWQEMPAAEASWTYDWSYSTYNFKMFGIEVDPENDQIVYAWGGTEHGPLYGGIWKTENAGKSWIKIYGNDFSGNPKQHTYTNRFKIAPSNNNVIYRWVDPDLNILQTPINVFGRSTNAGNTWVDRQAGVELPVNAGIFDLDVHPTNEDVTVASVGWFYYLYKSITDEAGIYISTNEGQSFVLLLTDEAGYYRGDPGESFGIPNFRTVNFNPASPNKILAIKSTGYWYGLDRSGPLELTSGEVYVSNDLGQTWTTKEFSNEEMNTEYVGSFGSDTYSFIDPNDPDHILYYQRYTFRTTDSGNNWTTTNFWSGIPKIIFSSSEVGPSLGVIYVPELAGASTFNLGRHPYYGEPLYGDWEDVSGDMKNASRILNISSVPHVAGTLFSGMGPGGSFLSFDYGESFTQKITAKGARYFDPKEKNLVYSVFNKQLRKTTDYFDTYEVLHTFGDYEYPEDIVIDPTSTETMYAPIRGYIENSYADAGLKKTADGGYTWNFVGSNIGSDESPLMLVLDPSSPEVMYKAGAQDRYSSLNERLYMSTDSGLNWFDIDDQYSDNLYSDYPWLITVSAMAIDPDDHTLYVGTGNWEFEGKILYTNDFGASWMILTYDYSNMYVGDIDVCRDDPNRIYATLYPNYLVSGSDDKYNGEILRRISGYSALEKISGDLKDEFDYPVKIEQWHDREAVLAVDGKTDGIIYVATENGLYVGYDYILMQSPSIEVLAPNYGFNLNSYTMRIWGNYFLADVNKVTLTGPSSQTEELTVANGGILSSAPTLITVKVPGGLELGTWEAQVEVLRNSTIHISDTATFEILDESTLGPQFEVVKFDGLSYVEEFAPMPIQRAPVVVATLTDPDGINDKGFSYVWINKATLGRREVTDEAEFDYVETSSTEGNVTFYIDPPFDPGNYDLIITAHDAATSEVLPDGNANIWAGVLEVESGPLRIIGDILSYPTVFKPLKVGPTMIAYNLSRSADVSVYIYDISGQIVLTKKFASGLNGGRAGYNDFAWNGVSDFGGNIGNGIYIIQVTSGGKNLGKGKLVVFE